MKKIDIEQLLRWAYRDELPKGQPIDRAPGDLHGDQWLGGLWVRVDGGGPSGAGLVPGEPHADALAIADAVRSLDALTFTKEQCASMLGDYAGSGQREIAAMCGAAFKLDILVVRCACLSPLEWDIGTPQLKPVTRASNRRAIVYGLDITRGAFGDEIVGLIEVSPDKKGRWPLTREPRAHVVFEEPSIGQLLEARAEYAAWHAAMTMIAHAVAGKLVDHVALPPMRSPSPWFVPDGVVATSRVLSVKPSRSLAKLPLRERRPTTRAPLTAADAVTMRKRHYELAEKAVAAENPSE